MKIIEMRRATGAIGLALLLASVLTSCADLPDNEEALAAETREAAALPIPPEGPFDATSPADWQRLRESMQRCIPPSVMMHSKDSRRVVPLTRYLAKSEHTTITYRDFARIVAGEQPRPRQPILLSIDDIPTDWIRSEFSTMVEDLKRAKMVASLAVNPRAIHPQQSPLDSCNLDSLHDATLDKVPMPTRMKNWDKLRSWITAGFSMESHTCDHVNLASLSSRVKTIAGRRTADCQLRDAAGRLTFGAGQEPVALITPFGQPMAFDPATMKMAPGYPIIRDYVKENTPHQFIVGIADGFARRITPEASASGERTLSYPLFLGRFNVDYLATDASDVQGAIAAIESWQRSNADCYYLPKQMAAVLDRGQGQTGEDALAVAEQWAAAIAAGHVVTAAALYSSSAQVITPTARLSETDSPAAISSWLTAWIDGPGKLAPLEVASLSVDGQMIRISWSATTTSPSTATSPSTTMSPSTSVSPAASASPSTSKARYGEDWLRIEAGKIVMHYTSLTAP